MYLDLIFLFFPLELLPAQILRLILVLRLVEPSTLVRPNTIPNTRKMEKKEVIFRGKKRFSRLKRKAKKKEKVTLMVFFYQYYYYKFPMY